MKTFDEWHLAKFGASFDDMYMGESMRIGVALKTLADLVRQYASESVAEVCAKGGDDVA